MDHNIILKIEILMNNKITKVSRSRFSSYLSDGKQRKRGKTHISYWGNIKRGVPNGSISSP